MEARGVIENAADLGRIVNAVRREHNLSQAQLARLVGVSQRYLSELETGKPKVFDDDFVRLLAKIGVHLEARIQA